jgi:nitronate monooxygenase
MNTVADKMAAIKSRLALPAVAAPMFLISTAELVIATCAAGVIGSFPTNNARTPQDLDDWLDRITGELAAAERARPGRVAPWAVNVIVHSTSPRFETDFPRVLKRKPDIVITALGSPARVVDAVHAYGGLVFADVNTVAQARKSIAAGADGLVLIAAGAGGHTGTLSPFAFVSAIRAFFDGPLILGGGIVDGAGVRAVEVLGADLAYLGTRFIATPESMASDRYREILVDATEEDIVLTAALSGVPANFLKQSILDAGLDPAALVGHTGSRFNADTDVHPWRDMCGAGHGVRAVKAVQPAADIVTELAAQYAVAKQRA